MTNNDNSADTLSVSIQSVERSGGNMELIVRLSNTATRALHYITDVRATKYEPNTKTLTLSLSDEGREVIPSTISKLPVFRYIDPESEAEIRIAIPDRLVKLSRTTPSGELAFESYQLSELEEVVVEVAWADVPYYVDTRQTDELRLPAARWQQHKARATRFLRNNTGQ